MRVTDTSDLWWKTAVIYCLDVETFLDWNNDGVGDFAGLSHRLDYLQELGVTCLWLMPFYPSPEMDDGYDVSDFYDVDARFGHLGDLVEVIRTATDRGIRVIADLVVNHTSDKHPWFKASRSSRKSPFRDFYVWVDSPPKNQPKPVFPGQETSIWQLDERTNQYYLHNFLRHQPDLNIANPLVRDEIAKVIGFWMQLGLSGFRVDAVPFFIDSAGTADRHKYLQSVRSYLSRRSGEAVLLGEVNLSYKEQLDYFEGPEGSELTMQFDFLGMQHLYLSLARGDARPLAKTLIRRPVLDVEAQWANFVRNHDELTLDKLSDAERNEVFDAFAPDAAQRVYGRGIVRRLPSMLGGDPRRIRMVYSLLFSLPGTPVLFYGEEIGMGENADIHDRAAVRTPMQWNSGRNGGFSDTRPSSLVAPMVSGGFGPEHINVSAQRHDPDSLLQFMRLLIDRYRASPEIGWGEFELLEHDHQAVLAHSVTGAEGRLIAVHNFGAESATIELTIDGLDDSMQLVDLLHDGSIHPSAKGEVTIALEGYGYRWLRVLAPGDKRLC